MKAQCVWTPRRFTERADILQFMMDMDENDFIYHWDDDAADCLSEHGLDARMTAGIQANVNKMLEVCEKLKVEPFGMAMTISRRDEHSGPIKFETDTIRMVEVYEALLNQAYRLHTTFGHAEEPFDRDRALANLDKLNMYPQNMHETLAFEIALEAM